MSGLDVEVIAVKNFVVRLGNKIHMAETAIDTSNKAIKNCTDDSKRNA